MHCFVRTCSVGSSSCRSAYHDHKSLVNRVRVVDGLMSLSLYTTFLKNKDQGYGKKENTACRHSRVKTLAPTGRVMHDMKQHRTKLMQEVIGQTPASLHASKTIIIIIVHSTFPRLAMKEVADVSTLDSIPACCWLFYTHFVRTRR